MTKRAAAWGWNHYGQLGNIGQADARLPVAVDMSGVLVGHRVTAISAGAGHTCVVADGRAYCWGRNNRGQLGNNTTKDSLVPVAVSTVGALHNKTVTAISAGYRHSCLVADGRAYCWGRNKRGRLGDSSVTDSAVPVAVNSAGVLGGKAVSTISTGRAHSCVVADGGAYCWGSNFNAGQLGNNSTVSSSVPVAVDASGLLTGKTVTAISAGDWHTCAVADGRAYCWGANDHGLLGDGSTIGSTAPVAVENSGDLEGHTVTAISSGYRHTCALADGRAYCWGENYNGQLGNNSNTGSKVPTAVDTSGALAGVTVTAISVGMSHTCALGGGRVFCWGNNGMGRLGINSAAPLSKVPVQVDTSGVLEGKPVTAVSAGLVHTAVLFDAPNGSPMMKEQTLAVALPARIRMSGLTVITPKNARTNAGQQVRTLVTGGATESSSRGGRPFTVVRGPKGKTSVRTYGATDLRLKVIQKAPAVGDFPAFRRKAVYVHGLRR